LSSLDFVPFLVLVVVIVFIMLVLRHYFQSKLQRIKDLMDYASVNKLEYHGRVTDKYIERLPRFTFLARHKYSYTNWIEGRLRGENIKIFDYIIHRPHMTDIVQTVIFISKKNYSMPAWSGSSVGLLHSNVESQLSGLKRIELENKDFDPFFAIYGISEYKIVTLLSKNIQKYIKDNFKGFSIEANHHGFIFYKAHLNLDVEEIKDILPRIMTLTNMFKANRPGKLKITSRKTKKKAAKTAKKVTKKTTVKKRSKPKIKATKKKVTKRKTPDKKFTKKKTMKKKR